MQEVFEKIIGKLEDKRKTSEQLIMENPQDKLDEIQSQTAEDFASAYKDAINIVKQAAEEYNNKKTNADRIRAMSDEELSKFIGKFLESMSDCEKCPAKTEAFLCVSCADEILDWLRKEVEE